MNRRQLLFVLICLGSLGLAFGYGARVRMRGTADPAGAEHRQEIDDPAQLEAVRVRPHVLFINKQRGKGFGRVALVPLDAPDGPRYLTPLRCERVDFSDHAGVCLTVESTLPGSYSAHLFDERFASRLRIPLKGYPSRVRVSPDGHTAAFTVFVTGDSYASGNLSTRTTLVTTDTGHTIGDLEEFTAFRDGDRFRHIDFNYWGVTFARQDERFLATLASGGRLWLVQGDMGKRAVQLMREHVECPSLSPDEQRIVFKSRDATGSRVTWRLHVLSLETQTETILSETRSVDDQATWIDNDHVLYAVVDENANAAAAGVTNLWSAAADAGSAPRLFLKGAYSPAIVASGSARAQR